jgi:DNA-binding transcriptional MerR regulator
MTQKPLSTKEAAERIGVNPNTLKSWIKTLPINPERDGAGNYRFNERALEVLEAIKGLRLDKRTNETIRRYITTDHPEVTQQSPLDEQRITQVITDSITQAIAIQTDLSEKYARAAHRIGELEATLREREAPLAEAREKILLLEAPKVRPWWKLWG